MTQEEKDQIDNMSYEQMLRMWRFGHPTNEGYFCGERGSYFSSVMAKKRLEVGAAEHTRTSKRIGWE